MRFQLSLGVKWEPLQDTELPFLKTMRRESEKGMVVPVLQRRKLKQDLPTQRPWSPGQPAPRRRTRCCLRADFPHREVIQALRMSPSPTATQGTLLRDPTSSALNSTQNCHPGRRLKPQKSPRRTVVVSPALSGSKVLSYCLISLRLCFHVCFSGSSLSSWCFCLRFYSFF